MYTDDHAEELKKHAGEKWRPANGQEGDMFYSHFCESCKNEDKDNDKYCPIYGLTMIHNVEDDEYPAQWRIWENGKPVCTDYDPEEDDEMSVTLTGKQIKELAEIAGLTIVKNDSDLDGDEEYTISLCPKKGIKDESTGKIEYPDYIVTEDACEGDGEGHPL